MKRIIFAACIIFLSVSTTVNAAIPPQVEIFNQMTKEMPKQYKNRKEEFLNASRGVFLSRIEGGLVVVTSNAVFSKILYNDKKINEEEYKERLTDIFNAVSMLIIYSEEYNHSTLQLSAEDTYRLSEKLELDLTRTEIANALEALPQSPTQVAGTQMITIASETLVIPLREKLKHMALKQFAKILIGTIVVSVEENKLEPPKEMFSSGGAPSETAIAQEEQLEATVKMMNMVFLLLEANLRNSSSKDTNYLPQENADVNDPCHDDPSLEECKEAKSGKFTTSIPNHKIKQIKRRGWTQDNIDNVVNNPHTTRESINRETGNRATAYIRKDGHYIVRDDSTGKLVQASDTNRIIGLDPTKGHWVPDDIINNPYVPK
ncbi:hypothetical protein MNBD_GAMMA01-1390 [hydrothermal vent metagenome]|uniref:Colicin E5 ribonuclease domain-containing protein n=1 Tax=hydrothermal vent metagenome TaxID=652676 RepID=A0A3B0VGE9_9ZZZZ